MPLKSGRGSIPGMKIRGKPALILSVVLLILTALLASDIGNRHWLIVFGVVTLALSVYAFFRPDDIK
jgi:uncharacterized membrane protein YfcA